MGFSTDAILAYGVALTDYDEYNYGELPWAEEGEEDMSDTLARIHGARRYPEEGWLDDRRKLEEEFPLELVMHCSYDCPMYILAVKDTVQTARRGYPVLFGTLPEIPNKGITTLNEWCDKYGIEKVFSWHLCSMMG